MEGRDVCLQTPVGGYSKCIYYLQSLREGRGRTDEFTRVSFRVFFFRSCTVLFVLFVVSFVCLHYCTDIFFFKFEFFFFLNFGHYWTEAELHADASIVYTEGKGRPASHRFMFGPPHTQPAPQQQQEDDLKCQECASVHKHHLPLLFLFISVSPTVLLDLFFFSFLAFGGFLPNKPKGETRVTILQVYDCSF